MNDIIDQKSYTVSAINSILRFLSKFTIYYHITIHFWAKYRKVPLWFGELYVWSFAIVITLGLLLFKHVSQFIQIFMVIIVLYRLFDILTHLGRMIFIVSTKVYSSDGHYILIRARNVERWVIMNIINIFEIILCFSILFLFWGDDFKETICDPLTAIYQSILTLTTLGYGEIHAQGTISKFIVIFQLGYFILFILLAAPIVFSTMRAIGSSKSEQQP